MEKIETFVESQFKEHWQAMEHMPMKSVAKHSNHKAVIVITDYIEKIRTELFNKVSKLENITPDNKSEIQRELDKLFEAI
jgi:hypothetical protein